MTQKLVELTKDRPAFFHFDSMGFFKMAEDKTRFLDDLNGMFNDVQERGGNLYLPSFSYSYTKKELYSMERSKSDLGRVSDYFRSKNFVKRTTDPLFSYLAFSENAKGEFNSPTDCESFGPKSLMASVFDAGGSIISVGERLHYSTPIHYVEKQLHVPYRFNKDFPGEIEMLDGSIHQQNATYYCRDIDYFSSRNLTVSFEQLIQDLKDHGVVQRHLVENEILIEVLPMQEILPLMKKGVEKDIHYLMKPIRSPLGN